MMAVGAKQIPLNCTTFGCWTCLFLPKQYRQRHSQCSSPRKQNRKYLCQSHLCRPDHSSRRKRDPWPNMFKLVCSLNRREFERHYCITADSLNRANIPPKRICDPVDLLYLFMWARDRCRSKKNPSLISNRTSHLTSNNFRRTNEKFVQLHARHFKSTIFFFLPF